MSNTIPVTSIPAQYLSPQQIQKALRSNHIQSGRVFAVCFVKRTDGSFRHMVCRLHVRKGVKGSSKFDRPQADLNCNCLTVYEFNGDMSGFKRVPLDSVLSITAAPSPHL